MTTYTITPANWNDPAFWSSINETGPGHTIDFSALPSNFAVDFWPDGDRIVIDDGTISFTIGDSDDSGTTDGQMGGSTQLEYFTTIEGSQGDDISDGGANNDTITGNDGSDTLTGNDGEDSIDGGGGDDLLTGGNDDDTLDGGAGDDSLRGNDGDDSIRGGDGDDSLRGNAGDDSIRGGDGNDSIRGGEGDDVIEGGQGADTIDGSSGADTIRVTDSSGEDQIDGGSRGNDQDALVFVSAQPVRLTFTTLEDGEYAFSGGGGASGTLNDIEHFQGGSGQDTLDFSGLGDAITVVYTGAGAGSITDGNDTISFENIENIILTDQDDVVDASAISVSPFGYTLGENIDAGGGNDTITGGQRGDTIDGGSGADLIDGNRGDDSLSGGDGNDTLVGGMGNDTLRGDGGDDTLDGGLEADTLDGGSGNDSLTGGDGNDRFEISGGNDTISDFNSGNSGTLNDGNSANNDFINLSGYYDHISELYADQLDDGVLNQSNDGENGADFSDNTQFGANSIRFEGASADSSSFTAENTGVVCFTAGTAIRTPNGEVLIENLKCGNLVNTLDNGPQPICWIGRTALSKEELDNHPAMRPILFRRGVFGAARDILVSPQHGMMFGRDQLARATHLVHPTCGIRAARHTSGVVYFHLMFEAHQIIFAESVPSESFYPGPMALQMMDARARTEVVAFFPGLKRGLNAAATSQIYAPPARRFAKKQDVTQHLLTQT